MRKLKKLNYRGKMIHDKINFMATKVHNKEIGK